MVSGKTVLIVVLALVLVGVVAAVSVWRTNLIEGNRKAAQEAVAQYERTIDSLTHELDSLRGLIPMVTTGDEGEFFRLSREAQDTLRRQVGRMAWLAQRYSGLDTVTFMMQHLGDSTFYSHYGHYDEPHIWWVAPEELGMIGLPAIRPLIRHLDSARGFDLQQTLYALLLASQADNVKAVTKGDMPPRERINSTADEAVLAWRRWANKWGFD